MEKIVCHSVFIWMCFISLCIGILHSENNTSSSYNYYHFGPNSSLIIMGFSIDNYKKYMCLIGYCFINSIFRSAFHNILTPWVTNSIQDITRPKPKNIHFFAYESAFIITLYTWFDWFLYYNILLAQMDMLLIELIIDVFMAGLVTHYYLISHDRMELELNHKKINLSEYESIL